MHISLIVTQVLFGTDIQVEDNLTFQYSSRQNSHSIKLFYSKYHLNPNREVSP